MILDFISENGENEGVYLGVPRLSKPQPVDRSIDVSSVIIVPTLDDIGRILQKHSTHVRAIVLMTNDGVDTMDDNHNGIPIIIGQQMRLPKDVEYSGEILIEVNTSIWSAQNQIILRGKNQHFLTPQFVPKQTIVKLRIPPEIDISKISTDMGVRREILGSLGIPRSIRITHKGSIIINPK